MSHPVQEEKAAAVTYTSSSSNPTTVKGMKEETEDEKTVSLLDDAHNMDDEKDTTNSRLPPKTKIDIYHSVPEENKHLVKEAGQVILIRVIKQEGSIDVLP